MKGELFLKMAKGVENIAFTVWKEIVAGMREIKGWTAVILL